VNPLWKNGRLAVLELSKTCGFVDDKLWKTQAAMWETGRLRWKNDVATADPLWMILWKTRADAWKPCG
jgi:hypothetical protein